MKKINNEISEDFVSFEIAKLLKEEGFAIDCSKCYSLDGTEKNVEEIWSQGCEGGMSLEDWFVNYNLPHFKLISRPTHALAIKWIRENFGIHIYPQFQTWDDGCWTANWCFKQDILWLFHDLGEKDAMLWKRTKFNSPEEATEAALLYTLTNLI